MPTVVTNTDAKKEPKLPETQTLMEKLLAERKIAREFQERRHEKWLEIYELYRNRVRTNRLTQRQAVNIPLMKETVKTLLSRIDDPPITDFKEKSGDKFKELVFQELWNNQFKVNKIEWKDVVDKKNVLIYGVSTKILIPGDEGIDIEVLDPYDVVYDPKMNPVDIETANFIVRQNIFRSLRDILADERYSKEGKDALKVWAATDRGMVQSSENKETWEDKMERVRSMGVDSDEFGRFAGGDVIVNLTEHYTREWNSEKKEFEKRVVVYAQDNIELMNESLMDAIGVDFWPMVYWTEDIESSDCYPDGVGDLVLVPNKVANIWFSQLVENRTLQNFNMHWYDATINDYKPQTFEPGPGVMLPAPGDPGKTIKPVDVGVVDDSLNAINFVTTIIERASGATAIEKGQSESGQQTLGEVEILVGKALERATTIAKFYRGSWEELADKWVAMMHANPPRKMKLYRTGTSGKMYEKVVYPSDWKSEAGYEATVRSTSEQEQEQTSTIQKFQFVLQQFPNNPALKKIAQRRQLDLLDLRPDELKEIEEAEEKIAMQMEQQAIAAQQQAQTQVQQPQAAPQDEALTQRINQQLEQLQQL